MRRNSLAIILFLLLIAALARNARTQGDFSGAVTDGTIGGTGTVNQPLFIPTKTPTPTPTAVPSATPTPTAFTLSDLSRNNDGTVSAVSSGTFTDISTALLLVTQSYRLGAGALAGVLTGDQDTAYGFNAGHALTSATGNTAIGANVLEANTTGNYNTAVGWFSEDNSTAAQNTAMGVNADKFNASGNDNTAIGFSALGGTTGQGMTVGQNVGVGSSALAGITTTGQANVGVGYQAGDVTTICTTCNHDTYVGYQAIGSGATVANETALGNGAVGKGANTVDLGNSSVVGTYINGQIITKGTLPTVLLNGCGTIAAGNVTSGTDVNGTETTGTTTTSCAIQFAHTWPNVPICLCADTTVAANFTSCTASTTILTITTASNTGNVLRWICLGN